MYKRQIQARGVHPVLASCAGLERGGLGDELELVAVGRCACLLYTSDAADERSSVDLGGRRIIKKKTPVNDRSHC